MKRGNHNMKIHAFRLTKGMDLKKSIEDYVVENKKIQGYKMSIFGAPIPFVTYNIKF